MSLRRSRRVPTSAGLTALALTAAVTGCAMGPASTPSAAAVRASDDLLSIGAPQAARADIRTAGMSAEAGARRPNVLLITADDAAPGDLRFMPHTRRLIANQGVTFTNAVAPTPICVPSRASLLTGQYTHNHKAYTIEGSGGGYKAFDSRNALPTWLRRADYDTLFIGKYLNGYGDKGTGTARRIEPGWTDWRPTVGGSTYNFMHRPSTATADSSATTSTTATCSPTRPSTCSSVPAASASPGSCGSTTSHRTTADPPTPTTRSCATPATPGPG